MISYPGQALALKHTGGDRAAARQLIKAHMLAEAERQAAVAACSMNCEWGRHADEDYGCANDGSGCLCACHDGTGGESL